MEGSTEGPNGTARMCHPPPSATFRDPIGSSTKGPSGTASVRHPPRSTAFRGPTEGSTGCP
eukprot:5032725-Pyramimonas_sp.AAC.1